MPESQQIGKYRILERIARGGMGTIFKAYDPVLDRPVALKVISTEIDVTDEMRGRFFREAQACARLSHPNIVTVYDMGEDEGRLFIVMELLDGEEMRRIIAERRPLSLEDKLSVMRQVCEGLQYAHQRGVVHRDIKPGNIMRLRNGHVKILDFGIAQLANAVDNLTRTGLIMGTLRYIAPEQVRGRADHRSDIYSVGAVFYELLSLRPPFDGDTAMQLLEQIRVEEPPPLEQIDPSIPPDLAALIARAMRKDPDERFIDLGQMRLGIEQVQRILAEEGRRVSDRLRTHRDRLQHLDATLADRIGRTGPPVPPASAEPRQLAALKALEEDLVGRIGTAENMLRQADVIAPALDRARELLRTGEITGAIADLEAIVAEMPEHARAVEDLREARAHADVGRRERLAMQLLRDARSALRDRSYALCLEILKQADDVMPPELVVQEIASLRQIAQSALAEQERAERALERMTEARSGAERRATPLYAPVLWREAEAKGEAARAARERGAYEEAGHAYDAAAIAYGLFEAAAHEEQLREQSAHTKREEALQCRQDALAVAGPRGEGDAWRAAQSRVADGEAALTERSFAHAVALFEEAAALFREAAETAKAIRQRQREQADEARESAATARLSAREAEAEEYATALWKVASSRFAAAEIALAREQYDEAAESFARASLLYREAAREAIDEQRQPRDATVVAVPDPVVPAAPQLAPAPPPIATAPPPVVALPSPIVTEPTDATIGVDRRPAELVEITDSSVRPADLKARIDTAPPIDSSAPLLERVTAKPDESEPRPLERRRMLRVGGMAVAFGVLGVVVLALFWLSPWKAVTPRTTQGTKTTQAPGPGQPIQPDSPPSAGPDKASGEGEKGPSEEPPKALPPRDPLETPSTTTARSPVDRTAPPRQEKKTPEGRQGAEQARAAVAAARNGAERAAAAFYAPKALAAAQAKEKEGAEAVARGDFAAAIKLLIEAKSDYEAAVLEARREGDAQHKIAPLKASVEQSRATTTERRQQALAAGAERLAPTVLEAAEAKHTEADSLAKRESFAAAVKAYDDASDRYLEAMRRAQSAGGTK